MFLTLGLSIFFVLSGIINLIYKPYYNPDKKIHLKKVAITQSLLFIALGMVLIPLYFISDHYQINKFHPFILFIVVIVFMVLMMKVPKWHIDGDEAKHADYDRDVFEKRTQKMKKSGLYIAALAGIILMIVALRMPPKKMDDNRLVIKGIYGITKTIDELITIDTVSILPSIKSIEDGVSLLGISKGKFNLKDGQKAEMFVFKNGPPFIYIEYKRANKLYLNFRDVRQTKEFYRQLKVQKAKGVMP